MRKMTTDADRAYVEKWMREQLFPLGPDGIKIRRELNMDDAAISWRTAIAWMAAFYSDNKDKFQPTQDSQESVIIRSNGRKFKEIK